MTTDGPDGCWLAEGMKSVDFHIQIFKHCPKFKEINKNFKATFHIKLTCAVSYYKHSNSTSEFDYQLVDVTLQEQLWSAACNQQLTDVEFLVGDESFSAHRFILSARSPVFTAMFNSETTTGIVKIVDTPRPILRSF